MYSISLLLGLLLRTVVLSQVVALLLLLLYYSCTRVGVVCVVCCSATSFYGVNITYEWEYGERPRRVLP